MDPCSKALVTLGRHLKSEGYSFTAVTPLTHSRVLARNGEASTLVDVFGWSRAFRKAAFPELIVDLLDAAGELTVEDDMLRSRVRFATLGGQLYVHSAYPTVQEDAVFFGPDTYRFARTIREFMPRAATERTRIIDIGSGSGAGGIYAATLASGKPDVTFIDLNDKALRYSRVNAAVNDTLSDARYRNCSILDGVNEPADIIVSNPPYLVDAAARTYRHGGERGFDLSLRIAEQSIDRLSPGGRLILYTGTAVVAGVDQFREAFRQSVASKPVSFCYFEIDPDVFGEELEKPPYDRADRIAAVAVVVDMPRSEP